MTSQEQLKKVAASAGIVIRDQFHVLHPAEFEPNPWNPNEMTPFLQQKLEESMLAHGFIQPVITVEREADHKHVIIDGEHRWQTAKRLGITRIPTVTLGTDHDISPSAQRQLTLLLNEVKGEADRAQVYGLVQEIYQYASDEPVILPYSDSFLADLAAQTAAMNENADIIAKPRPEPRFERRDRDLQTWENLLFRMPPQAAAVVRQALDTAIANGSGEDDWMALEAIAAEYLASYGSQGSESS